MMYCENCGARYPKGRFCPKCGAPLQEEIVPFTQSWVPPEEPDGSVLVEEKLKESRKATIRLGLIIGMVVVVAGGVWAVVNANSKKSVDNSVAQMEGVAGSDGLEAYEDGSYDNSLDVYGDGAYDDSSYDGSSYGSREDSYGDSSYGSGWENNGNGSYESDWENDGDGSYGGSYDVNQEEETKNYVSEYEVVRADVTWKEAKKAAKERGGHLAVITSQEEENTIEALIEENDSLHTIWLGGKYKGGTYRWITNEEFSYENWAAGEPNNETGDEFYMDMYQKDGVWYWNDVPNEISQYYSGKMGYVIEWEVEK